MEKLTNADINELTYWHSTPAPAAVAGNLAAQSYDPKGGGSYDPTTDMRMENLVAAASSRAQSDWMRIKRVIDLVAGGENGRHHVEILRRAFSPLSSGGLDRDDFRFPNVALVTPTLLERAHDLASSDERMRRLEIAEVAARLHGGSPMTVASRVLESNALLDRHPVAVTENMLRVAVWKLLERATVGKSKKLPESVALCVAVRLEMLELVESAGDVYRRARAQLGASRREAKADARKEREKLLDEAMGKKRAKETARYNAKLRRSA